MVFWVESEYSFISKLFGGFAPCTAKGVKGVPVDVDTKGIQKIVAVISIFSLITMSLEASPFFAESVQSTPQTIETISPLSDKETFVLHTNTLGLGQIFPSFDLGPVIKIPKDIQEENNNQDKDGESKEIQECREIPKKQITPCIKNEKDHIVTKELTVTATAYSSTAAQTDSSPCTTANGFNVCKANKENVIAANFLPFGTKVKFPEVYGDKIFTVQDRMNRRFTKRIDFWMKTTNKARQFGVKRVKAQVVEELLAQNF